MINGCLNLKTEKKTKNIQKCFCYVYRKINFKCVLLESHFRTVWFKCTIIGFKITYSCTFVSFNSKDEIRQQQSNCSKISKHKK